MASSRPGVLYLLWGRRWCSFSLYIMLYLYFICFSFKDGKRWHWKCGRGIEPQVGNCKGPALASSFEFRLLGRASLWHSGCPFVSSLLDSQLAGLQRYQVRKNGKEENTSDVDNFVNFCRYIYIYIYNVYINSIFVYISVCMLYFNKILFKKNHGWCSKLHIYLCSYEVFVNRTHENSWIDVMGVLWIDSVLWETSRVVSGVGGREGALKR